MDEDFDKKNVIVSLFKILFEYYRYESKKERIRRTEGKKLARGQRDRAGAWVRAGAFTEIGRWKEDASANRRQTRSFGVTRRPQSVLSNREIHSGSLEEEHPGGGLTRVFALSRVCVSCSVLFHFFTNF